jgi:hypothetical protein
MLHLDNNAVGDVGAWGLAQAAVPAASKNAVGDGARAHSSPRHHTWSSSICLTNVIR